VLTATDERGQRIEPQPRATALCPICKSAVRSKCGPIVSWHWAHISGPDCDEWAEPDTAWHRRWQALAPMDRREVVMGKHRADIVTTDGTVIELQHSYLPPDQIAAREQHYGRMLWLFDATEAVKDARLDVRLRRRADGYATFRWKHPRKSVGRCSKPVLLDIGDHNLLILHRLHLAAPCGGWGYIRPASLITALVNGAATA
jgi:competence protein CoiA